MTPKWQDARRELLYLSLAGMDACFFTPIVLALSKLAAQYPPERATLAFFVLILVPFYLVRLLDALKLREQIQRDIAMLALVLWVLLVLRLTLFLHTPWYSLRFLSDMVAHMNDRNLWLKDLTLIFTIALFWWRGLALAQRHLDVESVGMTFRIGVLMMAVSVGITSYMLDWSPAPLVLIFFFIGLIAVALARAEEVGTWRAGVPLPFNPGWLFSIVAAAGVVIIIALGLISVVTGESIVQTLALLGPVWEIMGLVLLVILMLIFQLLYPLLERLFGGLFESIAEAGIELPAPNSTDPALRNLTRPAGFENLQQYSNLLTGLFIFFGLLIVALMFGRMYSARRQLGQTEIDPVSGNDRKLTGRLQDGLHQLASRLGIFNRWLAASSIRRIYAQMVAGAARRGYPRADSDTPYEHIPVLNESWPQMDSQIQIITQAYVKTHYGEVPESKEELDLIRAAWNQIQKQA